MTQICPRCHTAHDFWRNNVCTCGHAKQMQNIPSRTHDEDEPATMPEPQTPYAVIRMSTA